MSRIEGGHRPLKPATARRVYFDAFNKPALRLRRQSAIERARAQAHREAANGRTDG